MANGSSPPLSDNDRLDFARHMLDYVYSLKTEADTRAQSILNTNTLMVGMLTVAATLLVNSITKFDPSRFSFWVFLLGALAGIILVLIGQVVALSVYTPIVEDAGSPFEPLFIRTQAVDSMDQLVWGSDARTLSSAILRECIAVSKVQIKRAKAVKTATRMVTAALFLFAAGFVALATHLTGY